VRVQVGGSDQWGNITAGTDLIRRLLGREEREAPACFGLTFPLLASGVLLGGLRDGEEGRGGGWRGGGAAPLLLQGQRPGCGSCCASAMSAA
jgi:hypothetical protein